METNREIKDGPAIAKETRVGLWHKAAYAGIPLTILVAMCFLGAMLHYTQGGMSMPLDDTFIYFNFARNIASGHIMEWTPGGGFSSAATCPLYPFVLAVGYGLGFADDMLVLWAFLLGVGAAVASFFLMVDLVRRVTGGDVPWAGVFGGALFLSSGFLFWGYLSGMEIPLFGVVIMASLVSAHAYFDEKEAARPRWRTHLIVWASIMSVLRPEGLFLSLMLAGLIVARPLVAHDRRAGRRLLPWFGVAAPGLAWLVITWASTGHFGSAGMMQKSYFYEPSMTLYMLVNLTTQNIAKVATGLYSGFYFYDGSPLFLTPLFFVGLVPALVREARDRRPGFAWLSALWFFVGSLSTMLSLSSDDHHFRYQMPFYHIYLLWAAAGVVFIVRTATDRWRFAAVAMIPWFLLVSLLSLPRWMDSYGMNAKNIYEQQIRMARIVHDILPDDALVGINDAGAIPYFGGRRTFDVLGLATEGQSIWFRSGPGSLYERFENMQPHERPDFFAIYPDWFFYEEIFTQKIVSITLRDNTICGADEKSLYKADWSILGRGHTPTLPHAAGLTLADRMDVADLDSERAHLYLGPPTTTYGAYPYPEPGQEPPRTMEEAKKLRWGPVVADGGRRSSFSLPEQSFTVTLPAKKDTTIAGRIEVTDLPGRLYISVNGEKVGEWRLSPSQIYAEPESLLPARHIVEGENTITFEYEGDGSVVLYQLWFFQ